MYQLSMGFIASTPPLLEPGEFSHNGVSDEVARIELEQRYAPIIQETEKFTRRTVSFQANKVSRLHSWFRYREGFSGELVELLLEEFELAPGDSILDPFAGSCTTLLEAQLLGIDATGIELLPHCHLAWDAKALAYDYNLDDIIALKERIEGESPPYFSGDFPHLAITQSAFPGDVESAIMSYLHWFPELPIREETKLLAHSMLMSILEDVSFTRKDGQYLRWDGRADKLRARNLRRMASGQEPIKGIDKGKLPTVREALLDRLRTVISDVRDLQRDPPRKSSTQLLIRGNTLFELPGLPENHFSGVITSPPYANRYDYTRTYALELAFLGVDSRIFTLRQSMLSCTVENKSKHNSLRNHYRAIGAESRYNAIAAVSQANAALREVNDALRVRQERGEINNKGVLRMIDQYFSELAFVFAELYRVIRPGAYVAIVNDNVRYAGEVIPVDLISTSLAEAYGFEPITVYVIPQRKGNSSQQMKKFGRRELRKSITIWQKPT